MTERLFKIPEVTPFVECPNCYSLLEYGAVKCPSCCEWIADEYAHLSAAALTVNTQAVSSANMIKSVSPIIGVMYFLYFYAYDVFSGGLSPLTILSVPWSVLTLAAITRWFIRYRWITFGDDDYAVVRRSMRIMFWQWLALFITQVIAIGILWP
jgi:hypothetical protein